MSFRKTKVLVVISVLFAHRLMIQEVTHCHMALLQMDSVIPGLKKQWAQLLGAKNLRGWSALCKSVISGPATVIGD